MIELEDGEMICNKCHGYGVIHGSKFDEISINCPKCEGGGIVDWVQNVMWSEPNFEPFDLDELFAADPNGMADLYYAGNKILETTKDGGVNFYA